MKRTTMLSDYGRPFVQREYDRTHPLDLARIVGHERYAWPGGYELALVLTDGALLCAACVVENFSEIKADTVDDAGIPRIGSAGYTGWHPAAVTHSGEWDDPQMCDHCSRVIAPELGEDALTVDGYAEKLLEEHDIGASNQAQSDRLRRYDERGVE